MLDQLHGVLTQTSMPGCIILSLLGFLALGYCAFPIAIWTAYAVIMFWLLGLPLWSVSLTFAVLLVFNIAPLRRLFFSSNVMRVMRAMKLMPVISDTEKTALEAGTTWIDGELFSGKPNFDKIRAEPYPKLSEKEQAFLDKQVDVVCAMAANDQIYKDGDLSPEVWAYLRSEKFFGMVIPEKFGGLGFSALAHSAVVSKLGTRSIPLSITVMVPNSLGPAELLVHYGTQEQQNHYLPRLASGEEIPCFGLTEPHAGSDAGAMVSNGVIFRDGNGELMIRLNWNKRYITLGAISSLIGLAVKLRDPEKLLGKGEDIGITCVLVASNLPGVILGRRHDPLGVPFYNCPIQGKDVVVPIDQIIGGRDLAGQGWRMLMESLSAGRSISLPAQSTGAAKALVRITGAYAQVRQQFGISISKFEGVGEVLARIGGMTYLLEAARVFTAGAVDSGSKPAVISAIIKYHATEMGRKLLNDGMDLLGGAGISRGPRNLVANHYTAAPIGITVEGANILTRTMIIFGQGVMRCHPYAYQEVQALATGDIKTFDRAFMGHIGHIVRNLCRALVLTITRGRFTRAPKTPMRRYYQKLAWVSASFAILADVAMAGLGGKLKFKEKIAGRFADILSWMYLITATLRRFEAEGSRAEHLPFVHYSVRTGFVEIQRAFDGLYQNLEIGMLGLLFKYPILWWSRLNRLGNYADDKVGSEIVKVMTTPGQVRDSLTDGIYLPKELSEPMARLENAMLLTTQASATLSKVHHAMKDGKLPDAKPESALQEAQALGIITSQEVEQVHLAEKARDEAIQVDSFALEDYAGGKVNAWTHR